MQGLRKMASCVILAVVICCSLFLVACDNKPNRGIDEGKVYGVYFVTGVEGLTIDAQVVTEGEKLTEPEVPLRPGYKFIGWKKNSSFWNFKTDTVLESFDLVATWERDEVSWVYTEGLKFSYNTASKSYDVVGYDGTDEDVVLPVYYNGEEGGHPVGLVGDSAFAGNNVIKKITLSSNVGASAFAGSSIEEVEFDAKNIEIGASAFSGTAQLKSVLFFDDEGEIIIGASSFAGSGLTEIIFPDSVTEIGASAFAGSQLSFIKFGSLSRLHTIGSSAFFNAQLKVAVLPAGVESVGDGAFQNNTKLETVVFPSGASEVGDNMFVGCLNLQDIYYTGDKKSDAFKDALKYNDRGLNEYFYAESDTGRPGYWKGFGEDGKPVKYESIQSIDFNLDYLSSYLTGTIADYKLVVDSYYKLMESSYSTERAVVSFVDGLKASVSLDIYKISSYSIYVVNATENGDDIELAEFRLLDIPISLRTIHAIVVDNQSNTIII